MKRNRIIAMFIGIALFAPIVSQTQVVNGIGKNIEALLQEILSNQQRMQEEIQNLKEQMAQKDREIAELRQLLHSQPVSDPTVNTADSYAAQVQYDKARDMMHDTIFEVRKGEQKLWFERVQVEFRKVVDLYPHTAQAAEAQMHIAQIYRRYLNDIEKAKTEFQKLIDTYPNSKDIQEARTALQELQ